MTTLRQDPGCSVAGKGLLINFQCRFLRLKPTLETLSLQSPTLQIEITRSSRQHALTRPKKVEPVTASFPEGAVPETCTCLGPAGSSLNPVMLADFEPKPLGWNRIGSLIDVPEATISG